MATTVTLKPNAIDLSGSTSGTTTLQATAVAGTTTITLPAATDTLVGKATTDTLTNKTLTAPTLASANITTAFTLTGASGTVGQILTSGGSGNAPTWSSLSTTSISNGTSNVTVNSSGGTITAATNGTTAVTIDTSQNTTFAKPIILSGSTSGTTTLAATAVAGTTTATLPAVTGTVMVSGNIPAFSAYLAANQSIPNNTVTKITINTEFFDTASAFDSATNYRFTPLVAGYYQIIGAVADVSGGTTGGLRAHLYKNGAAYTYSNIPMTSTGVISYCTTIISLNGTTDYVELYASQNSGGALNIGGGATVGTMFSGCLLRTTS